MPELARAGRLSLRAYRCDYIRSCLRRPARSHHEALGILYKERDRQFDAPWSKFSSTDGLGSLRYAGAADNLSELAIVLEGPSRGVVLLVPWFGHP